MDDADALGAWQFDSRSEQELLLAVAAASRGARASQNDLANRYLGELAARTKMLKPPEVH